MTAKEKYRLFCSEEKHLPIFSKDWYLDAVYGEKAWQVVIVEQGNRVIASLPFYLEKKFSFFKMIRSDAFTKMLGVYIIPELREGKRIKKIINELMEQIPPVHFFQQNFHYAFTDWLPLKNKRYTQTTRYSYIIDNLIDLDKVWKNIHADYRNNKIPKAKEILTVSHDKSLEEFYRINKKSFNRQEMTVPYSFEKLNQFDKYLVDHNSRKIFFAIDAQQNIYSVAYLIWDNDSAYLHMAGDDTNFRTSGGGILLLWECLKFASNELNINRFDFEGSMLESIEKVRRDFGAQPVPYFEIKKFSFPLISLFYDMKKIIRNK